MCLNGKPCHEFLLRTTGLSLNLIYLTYKSHFSPAKNVSVTPMYFTHFFILWCQSNSLRITLPILTTTRLLRTNSRLFFSCLFFILASCFLGLDIQLGSLIVVLIILRFKNFSCLLPYKILTWVQSQTYKVTEPFYVPSLYGSSNSFMLSPTLRKANPVNVNHSRVCMMLSCGFNVNFPND